MLAQIDIVKSHAEGGKTNENRKAASRGNAIDGTSENDNGYVS
jgi:hypothetical protein